VSEGQVLVSNWCQEGKYWCQDWCQEAGVIMRRSWLNNDSKVVVVTGRVTVRDRQGDCRPLGLWKSKTLTIRQQNCSPSGDSAQPPIFWGLLPPNLRGPLLPDHLTSLLPDHLTCVLLFKILDVPLLAAAAAGYWSSFQLPTTMPHIDLTGYDPATVIIGNN